MGSFGSGIKSIQSGVISITSATSDTATISAVDTDKSFVLFNGFSSDFDSFVMTPYVVLTNATTVTATRDSGGANTTSVAFTVVEYY